MYFFAHDLINHVNELPPSYLRHGTRIIESVQLSELQPNALITVQLRGHGGKGGFGSLLRAIGSQIERTTDQKSKRNLDGRRLRDIEHEKTVEEQRKRKIEREEELVVEREAKRKRQVENARKTVDGQHGGKHYFEDSEYLDSKKVTTETTVKSVQAASKLVEQKQKEKEAKLAEETRLAEERRAQNGGISSDESGSDLEDEFMPKKTPVITGPVLNRGSVTANTKTQRHNAVMWSHMAGKNYDQVKKVEIIKYEDISWTDYPDHDSLVKLGSERLTELLMLRALKTGGTIEEKATRLMKTKDIEPDQYPAEIRAQGR